MKIKAADLIIKLLQRRGVDTVSGIPGGAILPLYDALGKSSIKHILARHEQSAGFIAGGISRATRKTGVCFATSGPGACNLLTAIADAKADSIPLIAITAQVSSSLIGTDAFQEVDTYGMSIPITKHNYLIRKAEELLTVIDEAFNIAESPRKGPVLIDIPKDIQNEIISIDSLPPVKKNFYKGFTAKEDNIKKATSMIENSSRPLLYFGGGIISADASFLLRKFVSKTNIPSVSSLMGLGAMDSNEPLFLGMLGMHGDSFVNHALKKSELIIAMGVRFDDRAIGNVSSFAPNASIIHIDIDKAEIGKLKKPCLGIRADIKDTLIRLTDEVNSVCTNEWIEEIMSMKKREEEYASKDFSCDFNAKDFMRGLGSVLDEDTIIVTDVGKHQMWTAKYYPFLKPNTFLTSGGLGTMGFGLPTAIGAKISSPQKRVVLITGDGSLLMNIQELSLLSEIGLPITIILLNNSSLGLVKQQQEFFYDKRYTASEFNHALDFVQIAKGFGINAFNLKSDIADAISQNEESLLINVNISETENVLPMNIPGKPMHEMIGGYSHE